MRVSTMDDKRPTAKPADRGVGPGSGAVTRVPETLRLHAASRLYQGPIERRMEAGERLLEAAGQHGIDPALMWGVLDPGSAEPVRQAVLAVPGPGRTAVLFLTPPGARQALGPSVVQSGELVACLRAVRQELGGAEGGPDIRLLQCLPEPHERWATNACAGAEMTHVGELSYMRRPYKPADRTGVPPAWPAGVTIGSLERFPSGDLGNTASPAFADLRTALERTYVDTRDCPELCGLRDTADVVASHRSTGVFDPSTWWIVRDEAAGAAQGCVLMSHCPEHNAVELVYIGLGPELRGRGLARDLLRCAIARTARLGAREVTCAVDRRNHAAVRLYESLGFTSFAGRSAWVAVVDRG
jgi:GNAT superfamily N-acetyltransferase